jgi:uncharacterized membrane protein
MPTCSITNREYPAEDITVLSAIRPQLAAIILRHFPHLEGRSLISHEALGQYRAEYVRGVLEEDVGAITALEADVVRSLQEHEVLASDVDREFESQVTLGGRLADRIADVGGSWGFITTFVIFLVLWVILNTVVLTTCAVDPYPFILLNLVLSCIAALQAPVIMMSQNRQEEKDRRRAQHDYQVNLKAELEIRHLHEKMDYMLKQQSQRLFEIQEIQIELMEELAARRREGTGK